MNSLLFFRADGKNLFVTVSLKEFNEQAKKIKEGAVISVKYQGRNVYGTLQYPQFYRERNDVKWEDIIKN